MQAAVEHFERTTGRVFYGLAGVSAGDSFHYHAQGQSIERWVVTIPTISTLALFLAAAIILPVAAPAHFRTLLARWAYVLAWALAFLVLAGWYWINVFGVFV